MSMVAYQVQCVGSYPKVTEEDTTMQGLVRVGSDLCHDL